MMVGYARVSMSDQNNQRQIDELVKHGVNPLDIYSDKASGRDMKRPGWELLWKQIEPGDVLVVHSLDRLGRNLEEVIKVERELRETKGATLKVIATDINTATPTGRMVFHILMTVAQFEREWGLERTLHGLQKARERGIVGGRAAKRTDDEVETAVRKHMATEAPDNRGVWLRAGEELGYSKVTVMRRWEAIQAKKREQLQ